MEVLMFTLKLSAFIFVFLDNSFQGYATSSFHENEIDKLALLSVKSLITEDPLGVLNSWNHSSHYCYWAGVQCNSKSPRITVLNLNGKELVGSLSPHVGNLSFLKILDLSENLFNGAIPLGLGNLRWLQTLNLSYNSLSGKIPNDLSNCSQLRNLELSENTFVGNIPYELGSFPDLLILYLANNNFYGTIPSSLGNLTSLRELDLTFNSLYGEVPNAISQWKYLKVVYLSVNDLCGEFPPSLYNMSSLKAIALAANNFNGSLRNDIGFALPNLKELMLANNSFTGYIPGSFPNASKLEILDFTYNGFTGKVPSNLGSLKYLKYFWVGNNSLGRGEQDDLDFITSLTNCSNLYSLDIHSNKFRGLLPISIANLSTKLTGLWINDNSIHGSIPRDISKLQSLTILYMGWNHLDGTIPKSLGTLSNLVELSLCKNQLTGKVPASIGNMTHLTLLYLWQNKLEGEIPPSLANCEKMLYFGLELNNLHGEIPQELMSLSSLWVFNVSYNTLIGLIPENVGNWSVLKMIDLSHNKFHGNIPKAIGTCLQLNVIFLQGNQLYGNIPELSLLQNLNYLDLSNNNISENIPVFLSALPLVYLNLSFNNLEGEVPSMGIFSNMTASEVQGNPSLCGGIPEFHFPVCYKAQPKKLGSEKRIKSLLLILIVVLPTSFASISLLVLTIYLVRKKSKQPPRSSSLRSLYFFPKISYGDLANATGGFSSENLIGSGSFGTVYKGALTPDGDKVAVKVLKLERKGASKSFMAECEALKNVRHNNLIKVITACSSIDFQGNDFKALVYQFMSNGNLNYWLHPEEEGENASRSLDILQRIGIALDVASALEYLHHQCETPVIHCDLKPQNILLDEDMKAHVGDFGLARLIPNLKMTENANQFSSLGIKGTIGYAAPEYGMGAPASILGDVYSFGIVLLEIITGKRPTDNFLQEKDLTLQEFVKLAIREREIGVFDSLSLCKEVTGEAETWNEVWDYLTEGQIECLVQILQIGVTCSSESPQNRMSMIQVHQELLIVQGTLSAAVDEIDEKPPANLTSRSSASFVPRSERIIISEKYGVSSHVRGSSSEADESKDHEIIENGTRA